MFFNCCYFVGVKNGYFFMKIFFDVELKNWKKFIVFIFMKIFKNGIIWFFCLNKIKFLDYVVIVWCILWCCVCVFLLC